MPGWVYVIVNEAAPGLLKVGFTDRTPTQRALELGATGLPMPYAVAYELEVEDGRMVEKAAHVLLSQFHVGKEWFRCSIDTAKEALDEASGLRMDDSPLVPGHALAPYFPGSRSQFVRQEAPQNPQISQETQEDDDNPLPPGHPLRGML